MNKDKLTYPEMPHFLYSSYEVTAHDGQERELELYIALSEDTL